MMHAERVCVRVSGKVKALHPVAEAMARHLAEVAPIRYIRILPDLLEASSVESSCGHGLEWRILGAHVRKVPEYRGCVKAADQQQDWMGDAGVWMGRHL